MKVSWPGSKLNSYYDSTYLTVIIEMDLLLIQSKEVRNWDIKIISLADFTYKQASHLWLFNEESVRITYNTH